MHNRLKYALTIANRNIMKTHLRRLINKHKDNIIFLKIAVNNPRGMGAIAPSSKQLANEMVSHVLKENEGMVVELGPGTGVITEALLQSGVHPENIIVVEYSSALAALLRKRFPKIKVIEGTAEHLSSILSGEKRKPNTILSSIPLRSLPLHISKTILGEIKNSLMPGGKYIQYTYSFKKEDPFSSISNFESCVSKRIWMNFPPARVDVWVKQA